MTLFDEIETAAKHRLQEAQPYNADDVFFTRGELVGAAAVYLLQNVKIGDAELNARVQHMIEDLFPWADSYRKTGSARTLLIEAIVLTIAEIHRLDKLAVKVLPVATPEPLIFDKASITATDHKLTRRMRKVFYERKLTFPEFEKRVRDYCATVPDKLIDENYCSIRKVLSGESPLTLSWFVTILQDILGMSDWEIQTALFYSI